MDARPLIRRPAVLRILAICLLAEIGYAELNLSTMPIYLEKDRFFGASVIGLIFVAFLFSEAVFKGPMGGLADRFGPKKFIVIGPMISVVSATLSVLVPHTNAGPMEVVAFIFLRFMDGLALAMLWPAAFSQMNAAVEDKDRQGAMSLLNSVYMIGIALAFPVGGLVNELSGVRWAGLVLAAVLFAAVSGTAWITLPNTRPEKGEGSHASHPTAFLRSVKTIPEYLLLAFVTFMGIGFPSAVFKLFVMKQFGFTESQVGFVIMPGAITLAALAVPMSKFGEKIGRDRAVHVGLGACALGLTVIALGAFIPPFRQPIFLLAGGIPCGIGFLLTIPAWMAAVSDADPANRGANIGAIMTAQGLGAIVGAAIGGTMYEKLQAFGADFGRYSPFVGCAALVILGWVLSLRILGPSNADPIVEAPPIDAVDAIGPAGSEIAAEITDVETVPKPEPNPTAPIPLADEEAGPPKMHG